MIRAIYLPDIRTQEILIFELKSDATFKCITNERLSYEAAEVVLDKDWRIFYINDGVIYDVEITNKG